MDTHDMTHKHVALFGAFCFIIACMYAGYYAGGLQ